VMRITDRELRLESGLRGQCEPVRSSKWHNGTSVLTWVAALLLPASKQRGFSTAISASAPGLLPALWLRIGTLPCGVNLSAAIGGSAMSAVSIPRGS